MIPFVIDINGVLIKRIWSSSLKQSSENDNVIPMTGKNGAQHVYIRPHALDLIKSVSSDPKVRLVFWSSMTLEYMVPIVELLTSKSEISSESYTIMSQMDCTAEQHPTHSFKPLFVKDVSRIYERFPNAEGVIFLDDSIDKMKYNLEETLVIVEPWVDHKNGDSDATLKVNVIERLEEIIKHAIEN